MAAATERRAGAPPLEAGSVPERVHLGAVSSAHRSDALGAHLEQRQPALRDEAARLGLGVLARGALQSGQAMWPASRGSRPATMAWGMRGVRVVEAGLPAGAGTGCALATVHHPAAQCNPQRLLEHMLHRSAFGWPGQWPPSPPSFIVSHESARLR